MPLIKGGRLVADPWRHLADDEPVPATAPRVTVSHARWRAGRDALARGTAGAGPAPAQRCLAARHRRGELERFALIVLDFPRFTDGRAYSQARLLRARLGYGGELRADRRRAARPAPLHAALRLRRLRRRRARRRRELARGVRRVRRVLSAGRGRPSLAVAPPPCRRARFYGCLRPRGLSSSPLLGSTLSP